MSWHERLVYLNPHPHRWTSQLLHLTATVFSHTPPSLIYLCPTEAAQQLRRWHQNTPTFETRSRTATITRTRTSYCVVTSIDACAVINSAMLATSDCRASRPYMSDPLMVLPH